MPERLFVRVLPHCFYSRRAYASQVATSIPAFSAPLHTTRGLPGGSGSRELGAVFCSSSFDMATEYLGLPEGTQSNPVVLLTLKPYEPDA